MADPPFVQLGPALAPAEAAYLEDELRRRGIDCRVLGDEGGPARVLVPAGRLGEALRLEEELLSEEPEEVASPVLARRAKAWLGAGVAFAGILYLLKTLSRATAGLAAFGVAALVFLAVAHGGDDPPDPDPGSEPPAGEDRRTS